MAGRLGLLRSMWRVCGSIKLAAVLLFLVLAVSLVCYLFPQIPDDPVAHGLRLRVVSLLYRQAGDLLRALGLFHAYRSPCFLIPLGALSLEALICTFQRLPRIRHSLTLEPVVRAGAFCGRSHALRAEWPVQSFGQGLPRMLGALRAQGSRYRLANAATEAELGYTETVQGAAYVADEGGHWGMACTAGSHLATLALTRSRSGVMGF